MMSHIAIIGAGGWGTALGLVAGRAGHAVKLWSRNAEVVAGINERRVNGVYLAAHEFVGDARATCELGEAVRGAQVVILAAPSHATRDLLERMANDLRAEVVLVSATKGIEIETGQRMSEVAGEVLGREVAAGMVSGLGLGSNSIAALITRGLAEITRLALVEGGRAETLAGLAGLGDLVLTCTGALSRNRYVGQELGRGRTLEEILGGMHEVAEGVRTTRAVKLLAESRGIEMPITEQVHAVLYEGKSVRAAAEDLMARPLRGEFSGITS
jgi:glycerol-3-phosphate dehydrogenase